MRKYDIFKRILSMVMLSCGFTLGTGANTSADDAPAYMLAAPSVSGALGVEGTQLMGSNGEPVQLKGISTHGLAWFPEYVNEECFRQLHEEWQVNVIRLAMYTAESGGYCTDGDQETLKSLIHKGVQYATGQDMYVIIDWHILSDHNPNINKAEAEAFFEEMSQEYADADNVLYEICNEPNGGTTWQEIKEYAEEVIPVIRANDEDAVILVGTPNWSQDVNEAALDPISGYDNIMYTLHFYAATHREELRSRMTAAQEAGLPIFVSEYGICDASGNGAIDEAQADAWVETMDRCGISYVAWNLSNKEETSAIFKSSCDRTSSFKDEDLSASGRWLYEMLTGRETVEVESGQTGRQDDDTDRQGEIFVSDDGLEVKIDIVNSWQAEGKTYNQYNLTIQNVSDSKCSEWEIEMQFKEELELADGWNGNYSLEGNTLRITSKEYNGIIPVGEEVKDIGFIISGGGGIEV